ncbi:MAG: hypothetical protein HQL53_11770, partial [Magnetococcales bacterium]|nr:hypothetical protein [Magnetococcales bacterium]
TGAYDKFVFNILQENWIYGEAPPGAEAIIPEVQALMAQKRADFGIGVDELKSKRR